MGNLLLSCMSETLEQVLRSLRKGVYGKVENPIYACILNIMEHFIYLVSLSMKVRGLRGPESLDKVSLKQVAGEGSSTQRHIGEVLGTLQLKISEQLPNVIYRLTLLSISHAKCSD